MTFNSLTFLFFFLIVLALYNMPIAWRRKKEMLLISSYLFYAAWNPPFVALLWLSTVVDWFASKKIPQATTKTRRRTLLTISLATNLGLLSFFKYGNFLLDNFQAVLAAVGVHYQPPDMSIILPMGISFYTFQTLSYTIDVYRGQCKPWTSFLDFALYVTFFPQLVAGPIVRAVDFLPQCQQPLKATRAQLGWGLCLIIIGLFHKNILADSLLAPVTDEIYAHPEEATFLSAWVGTFAFSGQIFCDFSGYSLCGIGVGMCLGFALPDNFHKPYGAIGFSDFWRRWHISLSSWLRDYLYIPLGGNRCSSTRQASNLMMTMLIGGLWHGAAWRFVIWGGLHGLYLSAEAVLKKLFGDYPLFKRRFAQLCLALLTYLLVCVAWVFFRAQDFTAAFQLIAAMFGASVGTYTLPARGAVACIVVFCLLSTHWLLRDYTLEDAAKRLPLPAIILTLVIMLLSLILIHGEDRAFIYFQF